jgi:hypothetical protein
MLNDTVLNSIIEFVRSLGIEINIHPITETCFLPGLHINKGTISVDLDQLKYPGDLLHEAAHIAVVPLAERASLNDTTLGERPNQAAEEMMAIAWSYAVCKHLNIDPLIVFHEHGYKGGGTNIVENFNAGRYFGVPMLQYMGMSAEPHNAEKLNLPAFPEMKKWVLE